LSFAHYWFIVLTQFWVNFIYDDNINNIVKPLLVYWFTRNFLWEKVELYMKEISIKHNGEIINLNEEDILHLWELVVDLIGEEI